MKPIKTEIAGKTATGTGHFNFSHSALFTAGVIPTLQIPSVPLSL
jgi:hypothetical protein